MTTTSKPATVEVKKRGSYRRLLVVTALLIFGSLAAWMIWGAIRDWADARALEAYLAELEKREPEWRDRVYGKPLTSAQIDDHQKWNELEQLLSTHCNKAAWSPYRQGLYQGMFQDAAQPKAMWPEEQVDFIKVAHQYWQPVLEKLVTIKRLPSYHRIIDRDASYEVMYQQFLEVHTSTAFIINEGIEIEATYYIMKNDPEKAVHWLTLCRPLQYQYYYSGPFLVERWLNLTQPQATSLLQLQQMLEQQSQEIERYGCASFASELRLTAKLIREIASGELTQPQIQRLQLYETLLGRDSTWNTGWLKSARQYYLSMRIQSLFNRPSHLILRLHQLADRVEELPSLDPANRWPAWKSFAQEHSIPIDYRAFLTLRSDKELPDSDAIPEAIFRLKAHYSHVQLLQLFNMHAQVNTALAAVAAERFRLNKGHFPTSWSELSPAYLSKPVLDPYTGKPLTIKRNEKGIVIYSVGQNGQDDGGDNLLSHHYWHYGGRGYEIKNTNLGTRVYLPTLRRGPAFPLEKEQTEALKENTAEMLKLMKEGKE